MPRKQNGKVDLTCETCGIRFARYASDAQYSHHYCSRSCRYSNSRAEIPCTHCGNPLLLTHRRIAVQTNHFCNATCKGEWQKVNQCGESNPAYRDGGHTVACAHCGKEFTVNGYKLTSRKNHFCSQKCYWEWKPENHSGPNSPSWKGGPVDYYGPNWKSQRRKARKRDGYKCCHCGITETKTGRELDVHHLIPFREFGIANYRTANHLRNLICLCNACHRLAELGRIPIQPSLI